VTTPDDDVLARDLADRAGRLLLDLRARGGDPDVLRKSGDRQSHEFLAAELAAHRPSDAVLSEEGTDDKGRLIADRVWIVDPLDGTREFGDDGRTDWAVHVALWERGAANEGLTAGAVALPAQGQVLSTVDPPVMPDISDMSVEVGGGAGRGDEVGGGAGRGDEVGGGAGRGDEVGGGAGRGDGDARPLRIVVSRSRAPLFVRKVAEITGAELVPCGSAGAKVATVIRGETDAYVHGGGFYEWDTAAPVAVARAAGLHTSRIDGAELAYNQADPLMPDILVCRPAIAGLLLEAIREATHAI
jgi:3'(2'), 5'-bisphosphate nucleotidase